MPDEAKLILQQFLDEHAQALVLSNTAKSEWYPDPNTDALGTWQWLVDNGYLQTIGSGLSGGVKLTGKALDWARK